MALSVNDEVALTQNLNTAGGSNRILQLRASRPTFGIVVVASLGVVAVQWENGNLATGIPEAMLDQINGVGDATIPAAALTYAGKIFDLLTFQGGFADAAYRVRVVRIYQRQKAGATAPTIAMALCQFVNTGQYYETPASNLTPTQGFV